MPHIVFLILSVRDLMVALILIPICIDWFIVNVGFFEGDEILCKFAGFLDFFLAAEYPIILIVFAVILYTRKYPKLEEGNFDLPMDEYNEPIPAIPSHYGHESNSYRPPSRPHSNASSYRVQQYPPSKPPSVIGSVNGGFSGVNFTNILQAAFSYESDFLRFYQLTFWLCNFLANEYQRKSCS